VDVEDALLDQKVERLLELVDGGALVGTPCARQASGGVVARQQAAGVVDGLAPELDVVRVD